MDLHHGCGLSEAVKAHQRPRRWLPYNVPRAPFAFGISPVDGGNPTSTPTFLTRFNSHMN